MKLVLFLLSLSFCSVYSQTVFTDVNVTGSLQVDSLYINGNANGSACVGSSNDVSSAVSSHIFGSNNTFSNQTERYIVLGDYNSILRTSYRNCIVGSDNSVADMYSTLILGMDINSSGVEESVLMGFNQSILSCFGVFTLGGDLSMHPDLIAHHVILLGFGNSPVSYFDGDASDDAQPLLILGNGRRESYSSHVYESLSNALVVQQSGRMTITNRNFVSPTPENSAPVQPETLVVEGSSTLKGDQTVQGKVIFTQRQGDIWMGSFGRTEDQGPSN